MFMLFSLDSLKIVEGKETDVGSYKCQIPGVTQSADSVNVYFTKKLVFSPSTSPIYHHNTAAQIAFTCSYTKTGTETFATGRLHDLFSVPAFHQNAKIRSVSITSLHNTLENAYYIRFFQEKKLWPMKNGPTHWEQILIN